MINQAYNKVGERRLHVLHKRVGKRIYGKRKKQRAKKARFLARRKFGVYGRGKGIFLFIITIKQLVRFGVHQGHTRKDYCFLSSGIFYSGFNNMFFMNMRKSFFGFRHAFAQFDRSLRIYRPVGYITLGLRYAPLSSRYAMMSGNVFSCTVGIAGFLTNFKKVHRYYRKLMYYLSREYYKLKHRDRRRLTIGYGLSLTHFKMPRVGFLVGILDSLLAVDESANAEFGCTAIVDSDCPSGDVRTPIPGNDDSMVCVNFYFYIVTRYTLVYTIRKMRYGTHRFYKSRRYQYRIRYFTYYYLNGYDKFDNYMFYNMLDLLNFNTLYDEMGMHELINDYSTIGYYHLDHTKKGYDLMPMSTSSIENDREGVTYSIQKESLEKLNKKTNRHFGGYKID